MHPRCEMVVRQWRLLVLLRRGPHSMAALARKLGVCERTVRRDIEALQAVPMPIVRSEQYHDAMWWTLGAIPEWPKNETTPTQELRV